MVNEKTYEHIKVKDDFDFFDRFNISMDDLPESEKKEFKKIIDEGSSTLWNFLKHQDFLVGLYRAQIDKTDEELRNVTYIFEDKGFNFQKAEKTNDLFTEGDYYPVVYYKDNSESPTNEKDLCAIVPIWEDNDELAKLLRKISTSDLNIYHLESFPYIFEEWNIEKESLQEKESE